MSSTNAVNLGKKNPRNPRVLTLISVSLLNKMEGIRFTYGLSFLCLVICCILQRLIRLITFQFR